MSKAVAAAIVLLLAAWWFAAAPSAEIAPAPAVRFDDAAARAMAAVDQSADFAANLETLPAPVPGQDDVVFLHDGRTALVSSVDGLIWKIDLRTHQAEVFADPPLMAAGMHEAPGDVNHLYFCASRLHGQRYPAGEAVGLYRLNLDTAAIQPVVLRVPDTPLTAQTVYADGDRGAPELDRNDDRASRALAFCNDLEVSEDGRRIYFSEPFAYAGAAMGGGTINEAVALARNGRLWRHDLDSGSTRLIAEGFHFIDGVLTDLHPGQARESSVIVSQTPLFRLTRFYLSGPRAGRFETVIDGLTGMPDGLDRDAHGNIWSGLLKERSALLTWLHANAWIKPLFLRLPLEWVPQSGRTGVLALTPDGAKPLYAAFYDGPRLRDIASAIPGPGGIYLCIFDSGHSGLLRLPYPVTLTGASR